MHYACIVSIKNGVAPKHGKLLNIYLFIYLFIYKPHSEKVK